MSYLVSVPPEEITVDHPKKFHTLNHVTPDINTLEYNIIKRSNQRKMHRWGSQDILRASGAFDSGSNPDRCVLIIKNIVDCIIS